MFGIPIICNVEGLKLDRFFKKDIPTMAEWISRPDVNRWIYIDHAFSDEMEEDWYNEVTKKELKYMWGIYYKDKFIGVASLIYLDPIKRNTEIGLIICDKDLHGKGIGTEVVRVLTDYAFNELNAECIYYMASVENQGSIKCAVKNDFIKCGEIPHAFYHYGKYYSMWFGYRLK